MMPAHPKVISPTTHPRTSCKSAIQKGVMFPELPHSFPVHFPAHIIPLFLSSLPLASIPGILQDLVKNSPPKQAFPKTRLN